MIKVRRFAVLLLMLLLPASAAQAREVPDSVWSLLPANAALIEEKEAGNMHLLTFSMPDTGETILAACDSEAGLLFVETETAASGKNPAAVERRRAEAVVQAAYPGCRILFAQDTDDGKLLAVAGESFYGSILATNDIICARSLQTGEIYRNGMLTMEGALRLLSLHRPEAELRALELDEDDGMYVYEGEAIAGGVLYEFEMDAVSGKLLEWERD